jgi:hypothetical protein
MSSPPPDGKALYDLWQPSGQYLCHCGGKSGLFLDPNTDEVDTCPECDAINDYMRAVGIIPTAPDEPDGEIPF